MSIFELVKTIEAAESAEDLLKKTLDNAKDDKPCTLTQGQVADIGNVILKLRTFIEALHINENINSHAVMNWL